MTAIGFIEAKGLVGNIRATGAMLKAAGVGLVGTDTIGTGLVIIVVTGEMGAVKAATEAEAEAAPRVGEPLAVHVTPGPHVDITKILPKPDSTAK